MWRVKTGARVLFISALCVLVGFWPCDFTVGTVEHGFNVPADTDPIRAAENLKKSARFGLPSKDNIRLFDDFVLSYDRRLRSAIWVLEHLTKEKLAGPGDRDRSKFHEDAAINECFRATDADYRYSHYDRGHLAAAANHKSSQEALDQTFTYSNITPQTNSLNRGAWERLEAYVRWRAKRSKSLYVVSGPLYLPLKARDGDLYVTYRVLGDNQVSVPTHFFKVFVVEPDNGELELEAFVMPNVKLKGKPSLNEFRVDLDRLDTIERSSGLIFFDQVSRDDRLIAPTALAPGFKEKLND